MSSSQSASTMVQIRGLVSSRVPQEACMMIVEKGVEDFDSYSTKVAYTTTPTLYVVSYFGDLVDLCSLRGWVPCSRWLLEWLVVRLWSMLMQLQKRKRTRRYGPKVRGHLIGAVPGLGVLTINALRAVHKGTYEPATAVILPVMKSLEDILVTTDQLNKANNVGGAGVAFHGPRLSALEVQSEKLFKQGPVALRAIARVLGEDEKEVMEEMLVAREADWKPTELLDF